jgi:flagellin-like hook-associated protein FlgL
MAYSQGDTFEQLQYDALWESINENSLLPASTSSRKNRSLNTANKRVITAINEVYSKATNAASLANNISDRFDRIIGNEVADPTLLENLKEIDDNFFKAIYTMYKKIEEGTSETPDEIKEYVDNAINELRSSLSDIDTKLRSTEEVITTISNQTFLITKVPSTISDTDLFINGIYYGKEYYSINNKTITWEFTAEEGGFDLDASNDEVIFKYNYYAT